ncbi:hypothetical protein CWI38_0387p0030 [Hamiltosporidium tvaerminnensis]|uniref:Pre-rRNA-processing protein PNO1 n=2 Tax=Hamiltosporidium TaxID=1176354 RepID=A0A4Q9L5Z0_9MICR|nr:hypothetical protein LUQ84_001175 [Hamiltosporidium tvaerminnensis]TBU00780.1 hypothetical protein CWI37_0904p0020 [Hamiltosporidium tvaerminnensis]TBU00969.1 hypothetical protein CWI36_1477p0020 [Hamiltosporidium magnivora]TBU02924.1 hypothetical protein CWI39_1064p0020 [Hamiltosporidium magnivora]TBU13582.1 hypothetical protein CWI38_0387p0030 [Hamiltosporidium tvaerminnensis]
MESQEIKSVKIPFYKHNLIKKEWFKIYTPIVNHCYLQLRMNLATHSIDLRATPHTKDLSVLTRVEQYINSIIIGFNPEDIVDMLSDSNIYYDSFNFSEVKTLKNEHLPRAIGRVVGREGKTKKAIELATKTKILVMDSNVHIIGRSEGIEIAKDSICRLIMGSQPGKIYNRLRIISSKLKDKHFGFEIIKNDKN